MFFDKLNHKYFDQTTEYTPVSRIKDKYIKPFDKEIVSKATAKRDDREQQDVLDQWNTARDISTNYGTAVHLSVEYWNKWDKYPKHKHLLDAVKKFEKHYKDREFYSEIIVFNKKLEIAGTIDILEPLGERKVNIADIKTNGELEGKSYGNLLKPFNDLKATKINQYRLQLSLYKELAERMGLFVNDLFIEYWNGESWKTIKVEPLNVKQILK